MNIFKKLTAYINRFRSRTIEPCVIDDFFIDLKKPSDFKVGHVYRVKPGYHMKVPYYVEVIEVKKDFIVTSIPGGHALKISLDNNWHHHVIEHKRFTHIGPKSINSYLLYNQKLMADGKPYRPTKQFIP